MLIFGYTGLDKVLQWISPLSFSSNVTTRKFLMMHVAQILFLWEKNVPEGTVLFWGLNVSIFLCNTEISVVTIAIKKNRLIRLSSSFSPFPAPYRKGGQQKKKGRNGPDHEISALKQTNALPTWAVTGRNQWHRWPWAGPDFLWLLKQCNREQSAFKTKIEEWLQIRFPGLGRNKLLPCTNLTRPPPLLWPGPLTWQVSLSQLQISCLLSSRTHSSGWRLEDGVGRGHQGMRLQELCPKGLTLQWFYGGNGIYASVICVFDFGYKSQENSSFITWSINLIDQNDIVF